MVEGGLVHQSKVSEVFRSKREMWRFMVGEANVFLPDYHKVPTSFMSEIFSGKKRHISRKDVVKAYCP